MNNEQINEEALKLAVNAYQFAVGLGVEEPIAVALMNNAHQHWLYVLAQKQKQELLAMGKPIGGD